MKIVITVSQITPGGGLSKYICTLVDVLTQDTKNQICVLTTHKSEANPQLEQLKAERNVQHISLAELSTIRKYVALISRLRKLSPDVIINNYNATTQYILPFLPQKVKIVHILHNNTDDFYRVAAINAKYVDRWVAPTPALKDYFNSYTNSKYDNRVITIPHAVDAASDFIRRISSDTLQLTFVGVLYEHKGVLILPDIIECLRSKGYNFLFTFIGDGVLRSNLENKLRDGINDGIVDFTGRIDSDDVYRKLRQTDIFVYPTHIDAFGLVIAEAMMNGAIPVVTCLEGITDTIVDDGQNGYLVAQDDIQCFVERISSLIDDEEMRNGMSQAAVEKANRCFSKEVMRRNYLNMISSL